MSEEVEVALYECQKTLNRLVKGFDEGIATVPGSYAADDCRRALAKVNAAFAASSQDEVKKSPDLSTAVDELLAKIQMADTVEWVKIAIGQALADWAALGIEHALARERQAARPTVVGESVVEAEAIARYGVPQGEGLGELWYRNKCAFKEGAMWILALNARAALAELWPSDEEIKKAVRENENLDYGYVMMHWLKARVLDEENK